MSRFRSIHGSDGLIVVVGDQGRIRHLVEGSFHTQDGPVKTDLHKVLVHDRRNAWAVGARGTVLHFDGSAWHAIHSGTRQDLLGLWPAGEGGIWAGGHNVLLRFAPPGTRRCTIELDSPLRDLLAAGPDEVFVLPAARSVRHITAAGTRELPILDEEADRYRFRLAARTLLSRRVGPMPEDRFWERVAELGWGRLSRDYKVVGARAARLPVMDILAMAHTCQMLRNRLGAHIEKWEQRTGVQVETSDDGMMDLTSHIVGLGKEEYQAVMSDPALAAERARRLDYRESFSYVFTTAIEHVAKRDLIAALREHVALRPFAEGQACVLGEALDHPLLGPGLVVEDEADRPDRARAVFCDGTSLALTRTAGDCGDGG